jgi:lysophospholipase L1-like esterase
MAFGLVLGLLLTEGVLQVAALFTWSLRGGQHQGAIGAGRRVAFLGDSNTFGLGAGFNNSYPQVLQRRWNREIGHDKVVVLNLGTPGLNSSKLRQQLPGIIMSLRPDVLAIMIGVNDLWTAPAPLEGGDADWRYRLWNLSRVYRLLYMLTKVPQSRDDIGRRGTPAGPLVSVADDVSLIWTGRLAADQTVGKWHVQLWDNLTSMIADARNLGIDTILITYPMDNGWYGAVNTIIREMGASTQTPVIDLGAAFRRACPGAQCPELLLPDQHPTVRGHQLAADVIWEQLSAAAATRASGPAPPTPGAGS